MSSNRGYYKPEIDKFAEEIRRVEEQIPVVEVLAELARMKKETGQDTGPYGLGYTYASSLNSLAAIKVDQARKAAIAARLAAMGVKLADDPEIKAMRGERDTAVERLELLKAQGHDFSSRLKQSVTAIDAEMARAEAEAQAAAVDDALAGDFEFKRAAALLAAMQPLRHRAAAAALARDKFGANQMVMLRRAQEDASLAELALREALEVKKREYLRAPLKQAKDAA